MEQLGPISVQYDTGRPCAIAAAGCRRAHRSDGNATATEVVAVCVASTLPSRCRQQEPTRSADVQYHDERGSGPASAWLLDDLPVTWPGKTPSSQNHAGSSYRRENPQHKARLLMIVRSRVMRPRSSIDACSARPRIIPTSKTRPGGRSISARPA